MPDPEASKVTFSNLDQPLFDGSESSKGDLIAYLTGVADRLVPVLRDRPLSVIRVRPGTAPFMQKNLPKYTPAWVERVTAWAESSKRDVTYAVCNSVDTLLWFGNQRAVEYHPALSLASAPERVTDLVLDLDPPEGAPFSAAVATARLVRAVLDEVGLVGALKTSGAKGLHVFVPVDPSMVSVGDAAAATRAIAVRAAALDPSVATTAFLKEDREGKVFVDATRTGGATVVAAYSPRIRPGAPVSFPISWDDLDEVVPSSITIRNALSLLGADDPWAAQLVPDQRLPDLLVAEGHDVPIARVEAMHEGKRRARSSRK